MKTLNHYLAEVKNEILSLGGTLDIFEEFKTNLREEFIEFKEEKNKIVKNKIEVEFLKKLESPKIIARSLLGIYIPKYPSFPHLILKELKSKWQWYKKKVLSQPIGLITSVLVAWLLPSVYFWFSYLLNPYSQPSVLFLSLEITHIVILPINSEVIILNYYFLIIPTILFYLMVIFLVRNYTIKLTLLVTLLSSLIYTFGLFPYTVFHYLDPRWLSSAADKDKIIFGFFMGYSYWFVEILGISLLIICFKIVFTKYRQTKNYA